ncbi:MAG TPA: type II toxin-antitoxin system HipA family toxin YjjJ [Steroidobacteraceae bacterium]
MDALDSLQTLLSRGVTSSAQLQRQLEVSQPTLSRTIRQLGERVVRIGGGRSARYGLSRALPGAGASWPVFVVDQEGTLAPCGELFALAQEQYWFEAAGAGRRSLLSDGLPYFLQDLRPQGFIGRAIPKRFPELELPQKIADWSDAHALTYLSRRGEDCVGNLFLGDESLQRYLQARRTKQLVFAIAARSRQYAALAEAAIAGDPAGSSAAGEHPKFTAVLQRGSQVRQVLVKFSPAISDRASQRWSDLLVAEHLASKALGDLGVPSTGTELVSGGNRLFLESVRFDRRGEHGRIGVVSLAAVIDHHIGRRDNWIAAAANLKTIGVITATTAESIRRAATFGQLIGNTDMHFGNLSFLFSFTGALSLAPIYDMLPMTYAPVGSEELPARKFEPALPSAGNLEIWPEVAERAAAYWQEIADHDLVSADFAALAVRNAESISRIRKALL